MTAKTVIRTIFYQYLLLFVGISAGFILNAEWVGIKSVLVERSMKNIFYPPEYDEQLEKAVKGWGAYRVYAEAGRPDDFEIIDENVYHNEEWYWCRYKYAERGRPKFAEATTRVQWKTWEQYYDHKVVDTPEKVQKEIDKYKSEIDKRQEEIKRAKERESEILRGQK